MKNKAKKELKYQKSLEKLLKLKNADYLYISENGDVYSSKRGYLGKASKKDLSDKNKKDEVILKDKVETMSQTNPTVNEIHGGNTGAFERRQLNYSGFDGIISNITLPSINNISAGEQPWVYYGFDSSGGQGIEGGFSFQTGNPRWLPYIRTASGFYYADEALLFME